MHSRKLVSINSKDIYIKVNVKIMTIHQAENVIEKSKCKGICYANFPFLTHLNILILRKSLIFSLFFFQIRGLQVILFSLYEISKYSQISLHATIINEQTSGARGCFTAFYVNLFNSCYLSCHILF